MRHTLHALIVVVAVVAALAASAEPGTGGDRGQKLPPEAFGPGVVESMLAVEARNRALSDAGGPVAGMRNGAQGEWMIPSRRHSNKARSGLHYVTNKWGDTSMGIGFGGLVDVEGAWFSGHSSRAVWTTGVRVAAYRRGALVAQTDWFRHIEGQPSWFEIDIQEVDRLEIHAEPVVGGAAWYAMDDLVFRRSTPAGDTARVVVDFEDLTWRAHLTDSGYKGLAWERGTGSFDREVTAIPAPRTPNDSAPSARFDPGTESAGGFGTPPVVSASFEGPKMFDNGTSFIPPDSCGAAGPSHFVSIVNSKLSVYDKATGTRLLDTPLSTFWNYTASVLGDPRVVFDPHSERFFALASDGVSSLHIAISLSADPTGAWYKNFIVVSLDDDLGFPPDYPTLGVDENGFYAAALMVGGGFTMSLFAIDKAPLLDASPGLGTVTAWRLIPFEGALQPCVDFGGTPGAHVISRKSNSALNLRRIDGPLTAPTLTLVGSVSATPNSNPPSAPALGSTVPLGAGDTRPMNAVFRNGSIWTAHTIISSGRAACRWYEVDPVALTLRQEGTVDDPVLHYFYPSIAVNARGDAVLAFSGSHANQYAGSYVTGRLECDPLNVMATPTLLMPGSGPYNFLDGNGVNRWGDYSLTTTDPADDLALWTIQEHARADGTWGTWIGKLEYPLPCDPLSITALEPDTIDSLVPGTLQFLSIHGVGFSPLTEISVDGVPVEAARYTFVDSGLLTLDMPQVDSLGAHSIELQDGFESDAALVQVVAPLEPELELGSGDVPNQVSVPDGVDILVGGQPGDLHYVLYSGSSLPSVHPLVSLCLGNGFSELYLGTVFRIPPEGWTGTNVPLVPVDLFEIVYSQSVELLSGTPLPVSGCQSIVIVP